MKQVCAFTCVCAEDEVWVDQYLAEVERVGMPFVALFDRCTIPRMQNHWLRVGYVRRDTKDEFNEKAKQPALDLVTRLGYEWALAWDIDETWEKNFRVKLESALVEFAGLDYLRFYWKNLWGDDQTIRVDGPFQSGHRDNLYRVKRVGGLRWHYTHSIVNGAKLIDANGEPIGKRQTHLGETKLVCYHHGMKTRELREQHKARWDRIYSVALRGDPNPYGFWEYALDEATYPPVTIERPEDE